MEAYAPSKLTQAEFNAPLSAIKDCRAVRNVPSTPNANANAEEHRAKAMQTKAERSEAQLRFRAATRQRIKAVMDLKRKIEARIEADVVERVAMAASDPLITERSMVRKADESQPSTATPPQPPPSQLAKMRAGLGEQAVAARTLMLGQLADPSPNDYGTEPPPPPPLPLPSPSVMEGQPANSASSARMRAESRSVLRAVASSAARADRLAAREARLTKQAEKRKAEQRAQLAAAVKSEREAAERAEALRLEVAQLEEETEWREAEAVMVSPRPRYPVHARSQRPGASARPDLGSPSAVSRQHLCLGSVSPCSDARRRTPSARSS